MQPMFPPRCISMYIPCAPLLIDRDYLFAQCNVNDVSGVQGKHTPGGAWPSAAGASGHCHTALFWGLGSATPTIDQTHLHLPDVLRS